MKRMLMEKFRSCYHVMAGTGHETMDVTFEDVEGLRYEWPWSFGEFYEQNRMIVQLFEEVGA